MANDPDAGGWLTREQVKAHAATLGLGGWRSIERYVAAELVDGGRRGPGQGRPPAYRYPREILAQLTDVRTAYGQAQRSPTLTLLRHRLWWSAKRPACFPRWREDRLRWQWRFCKGWEEDRALSLATLDDQNASLADYWGQHRDWPYRNLMRGADRRGVLAHTITALGLGHGTAVALDDALDPTIPPGDPGHLTVGAVLDHAMGMDRARSAGVALPGEPGAWPRALFDSMPPPNGWLWVLARLTEPEAARIRDRFTGFDDHARARGFRVHRGELRDQPELAGVLVATYGAWGWGAAHVRPLEPAPCLRCGAATEVSPDQLLARCPHCGIWLTQTPDP
ncbi:MAG TPA: hypothetical protein VMW49_06160 [Candidatus Dormibacteraeota bacterium]|nr:hypothetical protein [Candidatus Dormibacteraeota bacterium]HVA20978.1 hypothetical protein [Candidatus Micrarchaeia archaeon]